MCVYGLLPSLSQKGINLFEYEERNIFVIHQVPIECMAPYDTCLRARPLAEISIPKFQNVLIYFQHYAFSFPITFLT